MFNMLNKPIREILLLTLGGWWLLAGPVPAGAGDIEELDANAEEQADSNERSNEAASEDSLADEVFGEPQRCVNTRGVSHTEILDDSTVVFHMYGSMVYLNRLPHRCNGLRRSDAFSYELRTSRLCDIDTIRAVDYFGGTLRPGIACPLGKFHPITDEQLDLLRNGGGDDS